MDPMNETERIEACQRGNSEEFRPIVETYKASMLALALNVLRNRQDAEDACQEAFVRAFRSLDRYDPRLSLRNWLFVILYRGCLDIVRKRRRFRAFSARAAFEPGTNSPSASPFSPERQEIAMAILDQLTPKERMILSLWANEDCSAAEIAGILGGSASTARVHLFNARAKIKKLMEKDYGALGNR